MRHNVKTNKLGLKSKHRTSLISNLACSLIINKRIKTTLAKAKALRPFAEKMVTLGKKGTLHHRRLAIARLKQRDAVQKLFADIAPKFQDRKGGYTRILKLGQRQSDSAKMAFIEWVDFSIEAETPVTPAPAEKAAATK
ncbi:MAG: 50S ribosomal protein L17 [Verrucomicrobiota bacterium]